MPTIYRCKTDILYIKRPSLLNSLFEKILPFTEFDGCESPFFHWHPENLFSLSSWDNLSFFCKHIVWQKVWCWIFGVMKKAVKMGVDHVDSLDKRQLSTYSLVNQQQNAVINVDQLQFYWLTSTVDVDTCAFLGRRQAAIFRGLRSRMPFPGNR